MSALLILSLTWVALLVVALVVFLTATALHLRAARKHLAGIADDLEAVAEMTVPLDGKLSQVASEVAAIAAAMSRVDRGLGSVLTAVSPHLLRRAS